MRVLILSWRGPSHPLAGGAEQATWTHAKSWTKAGHDITIFTSSFPKSKETELIDGIKILRKGDQYFGVKIQAFFWYLKHRSYFDLVVDEFHGIPFFTPLYVKVKILAFIHETGTQVWALNFWPFPLNLLPKIFGPLVENSTFKFLYRNIPFMTVSKSTKLDLMKFNINNISVVPNGVTGPKKIKKLTKSKIFTIIYLSALAQDKGTEDAIKAFELIHDQIPTIQFWIVGKSEPKYLEYLKSLSKLPKYFGYVSEQEKFNLLSQSSILIFPSFHEGWGLVNIEANIFGVPVVGYNVSGTKDSVINNKTGILCPKGDVNGLANSCIELYKDKKKYNFLAKNAKKWANKFNWENSTKKSLLLIQSL